MKSTFPSLAWERAPELAPAVIWAASVAAGSAPEADNVDGTPARPGAEHPPGEFFCHSGFNVHGAHENSRMDAVDHVKSRGRVHGSIDYFNSRVKRGAVQDGAFRSDHETYDSREAGLTDGAGDAQCFGNRRQGGRFYEINATGSQGRNLVAMKMGRLFFIERFPWVIRIPPATQHAGHKDFFTIVTEPILDFF